MNVFPRSSCASVLGALLACSLSVGCGSDEPIESGAEKPIDDYTLTQAVERVIDDNGAPHLYARSDLDLFYAMGYQQASDRLFQMEVNRRSSIGRLAEMLGEEGLETDQQARVFEFARFGAESAQMMRAERPEEHNFTVAFVAGVNRRIDEIQVGKAEAPSELAKYGGTGVLEHWTPADVLSIGVRIQFGFSSTLSFDILNTLLHKITDVGDSLPVFEPGGRTFYMNPENKTTALLPHEKTTRAEPKLKLEPQELRDMLRGIERLQTLHGVGEGSNGWVVRGDATDTGRPYFANDSHASLRGPNAMHLTHINSADAGGSFDAIGYSFVGVPGVQVGHNRHIAWGATTNFADAQDIWSVQVSDGLATLGDEQLAVETRTERIQVRQADGSFREETLEVSKLPGKGVFLPDAVLPVPRVLISGGQLLLGWPGFTGTTELGGFFDFDRARNLDEFESAVKEQRTGMQNWMAASADGIRLRVNGLVPDRGDVADRPAANQVLDGSVSRNLWTGKYLDEAHLPRLDETRQFIVTANNDPWGHTADNDPLNDDFYYGSFFSPGFRAERITRELGDLVGGEGVSREANQRLQMSSASSLADGLLPVLDQAVGAIDTDASLEEFRGDPMLSQANAELQAWDHRMTRDSASAALFRIWLAALERRTLAEPMGLLFGGIDEAQPVTMTKFAFLAHTKGIEGLLGGNGKQQLVGALQDALAHLATLRQDLGLASITWGDIHRSSFKSPDFETELLATDGADSSLNVAQSRCLTDGGIDAQCVSTAGAVYRLVIGFDDDGTPSATYNWPAGDRFPTEKWVEGQFEPLHYRRADVEAAASERSTLEP
ncbi:MAG: penicillin acylase family protein [Polyangiaceae bacterium]